MSKTVNQQVQKGVTLTAGLRANTAEIEKHGITKEMINHLEELCNKTQTEGDEQDRIKDQYHTKTAEVSVLMLELKNTINDIKKNIKPYYAQSEWIKFGIEDKK